MQRSSSVRNILLCSTNGRYMGRIPTRVITHASPRACLTMATYQLLFPVCSRSDYSVHIMDANRFIHGMYD